MSDAACVLLEISILSALSGVAVIAMTFALAVMFGCYISVMSLFVEDDGES